jgi:hypothetical protein
MLEVFRVPPDLPENLIAFCGRQNCYNLQELDSFRNDLSEYCGAYLLYYQGDFSMYNLIKQANLNKCCLPIYVGKAAPGGRRTGRTTIGNTLYGRLSEHRKSIEAVDNLKIEDFAFKVAAMEIDLVSWGEAVLIRHFSFVWNREISGFGIHDPGSGRAGQKRSVWDTVHVGRTFAAKLPVGNSQLDIDALSVSITQHCQRMIQELGCP